MSNDEGGFGTPREDPKPKSPSDEKQHGSIEGQGPLLSGPMPQLAPEVLAQLPHVEERIRSWVKRVRTKT